MSDKHLLFHECPRCNIRCNCETGFCSCDCDDNYEEAQCQICGLTDDHSIECPNNDSPFSLLIREGFD